MSRQIISFIQDHYQLVFFGQYLLSSDSHFDLIHYKVLNKNTRSLLDTRDYGTQYQPSAESWAYNFEF